MNNPMPDDAEGFPTPAPYKDDPNHLDDAGLRSLCDFVLDNWRSFGHGPSVEVAAHLPKYQSPLGGIELIEHHAEESDDTVTDFSHSRLTDDIAALVTETTARAIELGWRTPATAHIR